MDRLWAPWRMSYVASTEPPPDDFICYADQSEKDRENLVVLRTELTIVILNRFPYNNGHLLVAPRRQIAELSEMTDEELLDAQRVLSRMIESLRSFMRPDGFNVGLNLGRAAGAGLPKHLHWHIVPRWSGDTNFMTLMADARVIVQALDELWLQLRKAMGLETS
ncbi:MAG: HIT domain-containing protein [Planctomycetota bacterium]